MADIRVEDEYLDVLQNIEAISACLKRIKKPVQYWNKEGGRLGYLTYISRYVPPS